MEKPCAVYYLLESETREVRYVGISVDPKRRYSSHLKSKGSRHCECWIKGLVLRGGLPVMRVVAWLQDISEAKRVEIALIAYHQNLTNLSTGGEGGSGVWFSAERRAAHGARVRERYKNPEARAKQSEATKHGWDNPESRARARNASLGRRHSIETRARIAAKASRIKGPEELLKMREHNLGKKHSEETRAKMSSSHRGHAVTEETRRKISFTKQQQALNKNCVGE